MKKAIGPKPIREALPPSNAAHRRLCVDDDAVRARAGSEKRLDAAVDLVQTRDQASLPPSMAIMNDPGSALRVIERRYLVEEERAVRNPEAACLVHRLRPAAVRSGEERQDEDGELRRADRGLRPVGPAA